MHSNKQLYLGGNLGFSYENHLDSSILHDNPQGTAAPLFCSQKQLLSPVHGIELHPSNCPRNNFIFDPTLERSQTMFHPVIAPKFTHSGFHPYTTCNIEESNKNHSETEVPLSFKEDLNDIDVLLSLDCNYDEPEDCEEVSTARTNGYDGCSSPESYCNYSESKSGKTKKTRSGGKLFGDGGNSECSETKRKKMKTMVNRLRGIVPGGQKMNTAAVLDEAVRYLKSLKVEVEKHEVDNLNTYG